MHILHIVLYTFPRELTRRISLTIKSSTWSFPLFSWSWSQMNAMSAPLDFPSKKIALLFFCPWKGFRTRAYKNRLGLLKVFFLRRHKPNIIFGWTTRVDSDRKCNTLIYKIIQIVRALWLAIKASYMSVCKRDFRSSFISYFIKEM